MTSNFDKKIEAYSKQYPGLTMDQLKKKMQSEGGKARKGFKKNKQQSNQRELDINDSPKYGDVEV